MTCIVDTLQEPEDRLAAFYAGNPKTLTAHTLLYLLLTTIWVVCWAIMTLRILECLFASLREPTPCRRRRRRARAAIYAAAVLGTLVLIRWLSGATLDECVVEGLGMMVFLQAGLMVVTLVFGVAAGLGWVLQRFVRIRKLEERLGVRVGVCGSSDLGRSSSVRRGSGGLRGCAARGGEGGLGDV